MFWIIGGGLWLAGGFLFVSRICRFGAPEDDRRRLAEGNRPFAPSSAEDHSRSLRDAVPAVVEHAPAAGTLVLIKDGLNERPRASSLRIHGRSIGDD